MIKTFRGIVAHDEEIRVRLSTKKGKIGYRIKKFQIMHTSPGTSSMESVCKIFKVTQIQVGIVGTVDFGDGNLLGAAFTSALISDFTFDETIIFDKEVFNQDIYITQFDNSGNNVAMNYYIELETETLTDNAASVSTLRDIRLNPQVGA